MSRYSWMWNVDRPAIPAQPLPPLGITPPAPAEPFDMVEDAVLAVDMILRTSSGRPYKPWKRLDALLDQRNGLRPPHAALQIAGVVVPVIPGRTS